MGDSDKLDNPSQENYSLKEHIKWFDGFINNINIDKKIILVIHDWGSGNRVLILRKKILIK